MMQEPKFRYLDRAEVCQLRGIKKTKQFQDEKSGYFPAGERFSMRLVRWRSDVVAKWLEDESARTRAASDAIAERQSIESRAKLDQKRQKRLKATSAELAGQA